MRNKVIIIISVLISLLLSTLFYSEAALARHKRYIKHSARHTKVAVRHHKRSTHHTKLAAKHHKRPSHSVQVAEKQVNLPITSQAENDHHWDVNPHVWTLAQKAYNNAMQRGFIKQKIVTIIDYSLPSSVKRMWVVEMDSKKVLFHTLVAHGKRTGGLFAKYFSDQPGSRASSIGTFVTANTYFGSKGYSLRLRGLEPGFNDQAESRAIVVHGAWYATQDFAAQHGRLGLSWGCPAVSPGLAKPIINQIKNGSLVFAYYPDNQWLQHSHFVSA